MADGNLHNASIFPRLFTVKLIRCKTCYFVRSVQIFIDTLPAEVEETLIIYLFLFISFFILSSGYLDSLSVFRKKYWTFGSEKPDDYVIVCIYFIVHLHHMHFGQSRVFFFKHFFCDVNEFCVDEDNSLILESYK